MAIVIRWYRILEMLVAQGSVSLDEMRADLNVSLSTLHKSLEQLNEMLDSDIDIRVIDNQVTMAVYDYARLEEILSGSLRKETDFNSASKRSAYLIRRLLQSQDPLLIDDLAEEVGVSRTTINKDLKHVKELADKYQVHIIGRPNRGLEVKGQEIHLRLLYLHTVYAYFESDTLSEATQEFLEDLCYKYKIPKKIQDLWIKVVAITVARLKRDCQLTEPIAYFANELQSADLLHQLIYHIEIHYQLSLSQYEQDFLSFPLNTQYVDGLTYVSQQKGDLHTIFMDMVHRVKETLNVHFDEERLYVEMHNHLKFLVNRLIFHVQTNDIFHGEIKQKYPLAFEMAKVASRKLESYFNYQLELSEISYLALYFEMILRESEQETELQQRKIAVVCTTGRGTANMICRQLSRVLGQDIEITQYSEEQFNPEKDDDYFAIFTTIPLKLGHLKSPVIHLTNLFDDQWLQTEWQKVHRYHQKNLETIELRFMWLPKMDGYEDYLIEMASSLEKEGLVDQGFSQRMIDREAKQSTVFGNGIGFPHTINKMDQKTVLMLGVLEEVDQSQGQPLELIFLVAIPHQVESKMETELLELYDDIFRIASDETLKSDIRQIQTESEWMAFTKEKGVF
ncbi:BglG family transcription antiterminator [Streptococcus cameli]